MAKLIAPVVDGRKLCTKCREELPLASFAPSKHAKSGLQSWCRACQAKSTASWHQRNKEKRHQQKRAWYKAHPEVLAAQKRRTYENNKPRALAYQRMWRQVNAAYRNAIKKAKYHAEKDGKPQIFLRLLVQLCDQKTCPNCRRLRSLLEFDRDNRTVDGYSKLCVACLPSKKTPPGGYLLDLDKPMDRSGESGATFHEAVADARPVDPEEAAVESAMHAELWAFVDGLPDDKRAFLLAYMEFLDVNEAAGECGIDPADASAHLAMIRTTAAQRFEATQTLSGRPCQHG